MTATSQEQRFGTLLRRYRAAAGLSQEELAERSGLSQRGISDLERGIRDSPYPATVRRLADALGLDAGQRAELLVALARKSWDESRAEGMVTAYTNLSGVLIEGGIAIERARRVMAAAQVTGRCELVSGDFFSSIPPGGDAYILSSVIHNWSDECAGRILRNCRAVMPNHARLLLIEYVMPGRMEATEAAQRASLADLNMLILQHGRERTEAEHTGLLRSARLRLTHTWPNQVGYMLLESVPV